MPPRFEEISAAQASCQFATAEELDDLTGVESDTPGLIIWYDEAVVLTGSVDDIRAFLMSAKRVLDEGAEKLRWIDPVTALPAPHERVDPVMRRLMDEDAESA